MGVLRVIFCRNQAKVLLKQHVLWNPFGQLSFGFGHFYRDKGGCSDIYAFGSDNIFMCLDIQNFCSDILGHFSDNFEKSLDKFRETSVKIAKSSDI